ncbi:hypothetical protein BV25DRAFT_1838744 [Artomyces pyxidatus]|uniref:Uncharacterized protein n=1 Tax=Artomyces pyxidatus TaxID=48021 RepID=A0ACB8T188_9AGAM|nr:hypothetical protein BV25DRAFT_1838744 [Artomyces pyxidatus]
MGESCPVAVEDKKIRSEKTARAKSDDVEGEFQQPKRQLLLDYGSRDGRGVDSTGTTDVSSKAEGLESRMIGYNRVRRQEENYEGKRIGGEEMKTRQRLGQGVQKFKSSGPHKAGTAGTGVPKPGSAALRAASSAWAHGPSPFRNQHLGWKDMMTSGSDGLPTSIGIALLDGYVPADCLTAAKGCFRESKLDDMNVMIDIKAPLLYCLLAWTSHWLFNRPRVGAANPDSAGHPCLCRRWSTDEAVHLDGRTPWNIPRKSTEEDERTQFVVPIRYSTTVGVYETNAPQHVAGCHVGAYAHIGYLCGCSGTLECITVLLIASEARRPEISCEIHERSAKNEAVEVPRSHYHPESASTF